MVAFYTPMALGYLGMIPMGHDSTLQSNLGRSKQTEVGSMHVR